jgi:RNA polymerase sigma factor (sigma-70 family)
LLLQHLRGLAIRATLADATDGQLLDRFAARREEDAFAVLLKRHGPMVLSVCRRVLGQEHDAEDAFQATFCVLARQPESVRKRESVSAWLHGVAYRLALEARRGRTRRRANERQAGTMRRQPAGCDAACRELEEVLDQVLLQAPEKYRQAFVLCYLEGKTQEEAARQLGCPLGTVRSRLARGRQVVQQQLRDRGLTLSAGALGTILVASAASAPVPAQLLHATAKAALSLAAGQPVECLSAKVKDLTAGALQATVATRLRRALAITLALGVVVAGVGWAALHTGEPQGGNQGQPALPSNVKELDLPQAARQQPPDADPLPAGALTRLGSTGLRHEGAARCLTFAPNGELLAAMSWGEVVVWQPRTGQELYRMPAFGAWSGRASFAFSPDSKLLATLQGCAKIGLSEATTGKPLRTLVLSEIPGLEPGDPDRENVHTLRFSPDGKFLALALPNHFLVLDATTGKVVQHCQECIRSFAFSPDNRTLLMEVDFHPNPGGRWGRPLEIHVRDRVTGKVLRRQEVHGGTTRHIDAVAPDGETIATAWDDGVVLWELTTLQTRNQLAGKMGGVMGLAFSPDGIALVAAGQNGKIHVWDVATGEELRQLAAEAPTLGMAAVSSDGKRVAGIVGSTIGLWDVDTGKALFQHHGHQAKVNSVAYSPDGRLLASGGNDKVVIWDTATHLPVRHHQGAATGSVAFSPDGAHLALLTPPSGFPGGTIRCLEAGTGKEVLRIGPTTERCEVRAVAFSPGGKTLVSVDGAVEADDTNVTRVSQWDRATGKRLKQFTLVGFFPTCLAVNPDGAKVALGGLSAKETIRLCDLPTGKQILAIPGPVVHNLAFSPDGKKLVSGHYGDQRLRLWDVATGKLIFASGAQGGDCVTVAFSPDGRLIASASQPTELAVPPRPYQHTIRIWEAITGKERLRLHGHDSLVFALAFSPDGSRLASGLRNGTVLEWDASPARQLQRQAELSGPKALEVRAFPVRG